MQQFLDPADDCAETYTHTVVLSGAETIVGAHLLTHLINHPNVLDVYCLVEAADWDEAFKRVVSSLMRQDLLHLTSIGNRKKMHVVLTRCDKQSTDFLETDTSGNRLGISDNQYGTIVSKLTTVVYCPEPTGVHTRIDYGCLRSLSQLCKKAQPASGLVTFNYCPLAYSDQREKTQSDEPEYLLHRINLSLGLNKTEELRVIRIGSTFRGTFDLNPEDAKSQLLLEYIMQRSFTLGTVPDFLHNFWCLPIRAATKATLEIILSGAGTLAMDLHIRERFSIKDHLLPALKNLRPEIELKMLSSQRWGDGVLNSDQTEDNSDQHQPLLQQVRAFKTPHSMQDRRTSWLRIRGLPHRSEDVARFVNNLTSHFHAPCPLSWSMAAKRHFVVVTGLCNSGKTSIVAHIGRKFNIPFVEADALRSPDVVSKMARGVPLTDEDCAPWIASLRACTLELESCCVFAACTAVGKRCRDGIRQVMGQDAEVIFLDLRVGRTVLLRRLWERERRSINASDIDVQIATYETPGKEEVDVVPLDAERGVEQVKAEAENLWLAWLERWA